MTIDLLMKLRASAYYLYRYTFVNIIEGNISEAEEPAAPAWGGFGGMPQEKNLLGQCKSNKNINDLHSTPTYLESSWLQMRKNWTTVPTVLLVVNIHSFPSTHEIVKARHSIHNLEM